MIAIALFLQAATSSPSMVCGPVIPDQSIGAAHRYVAGLPIVDERGQKHVFDKAAPDRCKTDSDKTPPKGVGIPKVVGVYIS